jgi:hypothetical protein
VEPDGVTGITPEEASYLFHRFRYGPGVRAELTRWLRGTAFPHQPEELSS